MNARVHAALTMVFAVALAGCTTMQEVRPRDGTLAEHLEIGDRILVYEKSGRIIDMRVVIVDDAVLLGSLTEDGLEAVAIRVDDIERIESEQIAAGRTTGAVLGGIVLAPIAAVGAGLALAGQ